MAPTFKNDLLRRYLRPNKRVSEELAPEESFKDGEHPSEEPHPPNVLGKSLVKLPKERVSEERPLPYNNFYRVFPTPSSAVVTLTTIPQLIYPTRKVPVHLRLTYPKTPAREVLGKLCN